MELRPIRALKKIERELEELSAADQAAEEAARFEIVQSASRFSRRSKEVVDSTMSLSATLMRAGEVAEANRLLADAEMQVREEEAALIETVNEAKAQGVQRRHRISRLRLVKAVATVALGSTLMMGSAFGVALTNYIVNRPEQSADAAVRHSGRHGGRAHLKNVPVAGMNLKLTKKQFKQYKQLVAGKVDEAGLKKFLQHVLADDPGLVAEIHAAIVAAVGTDAAEAVDPVGAVLAKAKETAEEEPPADEPHPSPQEQPAESPSESESPPEQPDDSPEPTPEPNPTAPDDGGDKDGSDGIPIVPEDGGW